MTEPTPRTERDEAQLLTAGIGVIALAVLLLIALALVDGRDGGRNTPGADWVESVKTNLGQRGYDWMHIDIGDGVAIVSGEAPDVDSRAYGFEAAEKAIERADERDTVRFVVDATILPGAPASVGAELPNLEASPALDACQRAFAQTLEGRPVGFEAGGAALGADDRRLLDALAAIAIRCRAHRIEVGGHVERTGAAEAGKALSEDRAEAVMRALTDRGVPAQGLSAHGYGDARPLDRRRTAAADARNRRIEFTVSAS